MSHYTVWLTGTSCRSCELTIEREWKKITGVTHVRVNAATGKARVSVQNAKLELADLQRALVGTRYTVHETKPAAVPHPDRLRWDQFIGLFGVVWLVGYMLTKLGLFSNNIILGGSLSFGAVFVIGLVAASSSCIAVVGGLLLSSAAKFNERYASATPAARMRPVILFILGRIISYTLLGGLLGVIGSVLTPSPAITAVITMLAALYMIVMGLEMLHVAPRFLKQIMPRLPKAWSHKILDSQRHDHPAMPLLLGAATFFLPCGFTQALQLYALTTHNFFISATILLAFALGTAPALLVLGYASSAVKGRIGLWFFRFSGAVVILLGLASIQNGITILGYTPPWTLPAEVTARNNTGVTIENNVQVVHMTASIAGYEPNHFTIRAGMPVRWEIDGTKAGGCVAGLISRPLGVQKFLEPGINTITFNPTKVGEVPFSCTMGMFRGSFTVVN